MNGKFLTVLLCFVFLTAVIRASDFDQANAKFKSGDYAGAVNAYEKILALTGPSAAVYYNLGNSYQQLKQYGPAILAYERARLLTPRDPDLLANLATARKAATAFEEPAIDPRLDAVLNFLSRDEWSWLVVGAALFLGLLAGAAGVVRFPLGPARQAAYASAILAAFIGIAGATALYLRRGEASRGIILTDDAEVRLSPFGNAESLGKPGPGKRVTLGGKNGGFHYAEIPGTNLRGWLADKDVGAIIDR